MQELRDLTLEVGKVIGNLERTRREIEAEQIDRLACRSILLEIRLSLERMKLFFLRQWDVYLEGVAPNDLLSTTVKVWGSGVGREQIERGFASRTSTIDSVTFSLDSPQHYDNAYVRRALSDLIVSMHSFADLLNSDILAKFNQGLVDLRVLGEFAGTKPFGLDERWLIANSYLSALEIAVNRKRKELDVQAGKRDFAERFSELVKALEQNGIELSGLERQLPSVFWRIRNEVVHQGYSPDQQELSLIVDWVKRILASLGQMA